MLHQLSKGFSHVWIGILFHISNFVLNSLMKAWIRIQLKCRIRNTAAYSCHVSILITKAAFRLVRIQNLITSSEEPVYVNLLMRPGIDSQPGRPN
jgi:hypothetical protein